MFFASMATQDALVARVGRIKRVFIAPSSAMMESQNVA